MTKQESLGLTAKDILTMVASSPDIEGAILVLKLRSGEYAVAATSEDGADGCVRLAELALQDVRDAGPEHVVAVGQSSPGGSA